MDGGYDMSKLDDRAKRLLLLFGGVIVLIILIIVIAGIIGKSKNRALSYDKIEEKMSQAAEKYFNKNKDLLPSIENGESEVDATVLASSGFMKNISSYQKDKTVSCSGRVVVSKSNKYYSFTPYLSCGDKYNTRTLVEQLKKNIVTVDSGLYEMTQYGSSGNIGTVYVYRGDYADNYVSIDDKLWRIIKIDSDNNIMITKDQYKRADDIEGPWDNRFNTAKNSNLGINNYKVSIVRNALSNYYNTDILSTSLKAKLVSRNVCIGNRSINDTNKNGSTECKSILEGEYLSLLTTYDFMNASLDSNCKTIVDRSCGNYNYLGAHTKAFWLLNADSETTYQGYKVSTYASRTRLSSNAEGRMVLVINKNTIYLSGTGTADDPYIIK